MWTSTVVESSSNHVWIAMTDVCIHTSTSIGAIEAHSWLLKPFLRVRLHVRCKVSPWNRPFNRTNNFYRHVYHITVFQIQSYDPKGVAASLVMLSYNTVYITFPHTYDTMKCKYSCMTVWQTLNIWILKCMVYDYSIVYGVHYSTYLAAATADNYSVFCHDSKRRTREAGTPWMENWVSPYFHSATTNCSRSLAVQYA